MSQTTYIPRPFAESGTKTPIDDTRADGVVNLTLGYTEDYSRELGVDTAAKAVERDKLNWLLNIITSNTIDWQTYAFPQWQQAIDYAPPAVVRYSASGGVTEKLYRCLIDPPAGTIPTNTGYWEEVISDIAMTARIPMVYYGSAVAGMDANNMLGPNPDNNGGFWTMESAAIVAGVANLPSGAQQGYLECRRVAAGGYAQRYTDMGGGFWLRGRNASGVWTAWKTFGVGGNSLAAYGILNAWQNFTRDAPLDPSVNLDLLWTLPGSYHQPSTPLSGRNYPIELPGTLTVTGSSAGTPYLTMIYACTAGLYIRNNNAGVKGPWNRCTWSSELGAYLPLTGGTMSGNIDFRKQGPSITMGSPSGAKGYRLYSNVNDTTDGNFLFQSWNAATGSYDTIIIYGPWGTNFYGNVSTQNGANMWCDGNMSAKGNYFLYGTGTEHSYNIESTNTAVKKVRFVTNITPNVGIYDYTNNIWMLRFGGDGNSYLTGTAYAVNGFQPGSSRLLKDIEGENPYGLDELMRLETVIGRYKPQYGGGGKKRIFHIAENVGDVMPELMDPTGIQMPVLDADGQRVLDDEGKDVMETFPAYSLDMMSAVHTKSIQQLAGCVQELTEMVKHQRAMIDTLRDRLKHAGI